jgi:hypothetical protein
MSVCGVGLAYGEFMCGGGMSYSPLSCHLVVVGELEYLYDLASYAGGSIKTPGRVTHARQVKR